MSKAATRKGDMGTGHGDWPPRQSIEGSPDTFINGIPAHRQGDGWAIHCNPKHSCHKGMLASGSPSVFTNGKQQGRVGDPINCGSFVATGSPDTFIGDTPSSGNIIKISENNSVTSSDTTPDGTPIGQDGSKGGTIPYYASPGGGGGQATLTNDRNGGPYTASASEHATGKNYNPKPANKNVSKELGGLSEKYESNGDPGAIGYDRKGGYSYGSYQIASNTGTMKNFLSYEKENNPSAYAKLMAAGGVNGAQTGSSSFQSAWKDLASNDSNFSSDQKSFIQSNNYDVAVSNIKNSTGLDINSRSLAVQDAVWSTSVQNGPNSSVFKNAFAGKDVSKMSDSDVINAIYDERGSYNANGSLKYFSGSSPAIQNSVANRLASEKSDALGMLKN